MRRHHPAALAALLLIIVFNSGPLSAGFSGAASSPILVDVEPPSVSIQMPHNETVIYGYSLSLFTWTVADVNPGDDDQVQTATVFVNGEALETAELTSHQGEHQWYWQVPNISSGTNHLRIEVRDAFGNLATRNSPEFLILLNNTGVIDAPPDVPHLDAPYPNPFNPETAFTYGMPQAGRVTIRVLDLRGRHLRTLIDETQGAGTRQVSWDGLNEAGRMLSAGTYLLRLDVDGRPVQTRKAVLLP